MPAALRPDLALRSRAAVALVHPHGAAAGWSAAEILGASCGPADAPAHVLLRPGRQRRTVEGLVVHRDHVLPDEVTSAAGLAVTHPVRTAFDLARWAPSDTERVVGVDALAHRHGFAADAVTRLAADHPGSHGLVRLTRVLPLVDPRAESPMESRMRMALVLAGLPRPAVQHEVDTDAGRFRLDLAYPVALLAVEYDGADHRSRCRAHADLVREAALVRLGWRVLRFSAHDVLHRPWRVARAVAATLAATVRSVP